MKIEAAVIDEALDILRETAKKYPRAYANCHANHNTHPERLDWIILGTRALVTRIKPHPLTGAKFGLNGKRGNIKDPSADALAYGVGTNVIIADVVGSAGEHNGNIDKIGWGDVTDKGPGVWVDPFSFNTEVDYGGDIGTTTCPLPVGHNTVTVEKFVDRVITKVMEFPHISDPEFDEITNELENIYRDNLGRSNSSQSTYVDVRGRGRWPVDYLTARARGSSHTQALAIMKEAIKQVAGPGWKG